MQSRRTKQRLIASFRFLIEESQDFSQSFLSRRHLIARKADESVRRTRIPFHDRLPARHLVLCAHERGIVLEYITRPTHKQMRWQSQPLKASIHGGNAGVFELLEGQAWAGGLDELFVGLASEDQVIFELPDAWRSAQIEAAVYRNETAELVGRTTFREVQEGYHGQVATG